MIFSSLLHVYPAFGFCEYGDPEATLRALRLLHGLKLGTKSLVVCGGGVVVARGDGLTPGCR